MFSKAVFLFLFTLPALAADLYGVGQADFVVEDSGRNRKINVHLWYPIDPKIKQGPIADKRNPFIPVIAAKNAPMTAPPAKFPLVLLSHGSGGTADKLFWFTGPIVKSGVIVLGVDHPRNKTGDNSADGLMRIWERPRDLTFALNHVLKMAPYQSRIDESKIAAAGHSAGGTTSLLLAGGRLDAVKFKSPFPHCAGSKDPYYAEICEQMFSINFKAWPKETVEGDYSDPRVKAIIAFDPGLAQSFNLATLKTLKPKVLVFIAEKISVPQDEIFSKEFLQVFDAKQAKVVPKSYHMSFLQPCKAALVDDDELKSLCVENAEKFQIHKQVIAESLAFLNEAWR